MTAYPTDKLEQTSRTFCPLDVLPSRGSKACRKKCPTTVSNHMECHDREREREREHGTHVALFIALQGVPGRSQCNHACTTKTP